MLRCGMIRKDGWGAVNSMSKEDEYRGFAATCLDLAKSNNKPDEKLRLLAMADAWLNLADRSAQRAKSPESALAD
jgi:hypothetical protein